MIPVDARMLALRAKPGRLLQISDTQPDHVCSMKGSFWQQMAFAQSYLHGHHAFSAGHALLLQHPDP